MLILTGFNFVFYCNVFSFSLSLSFNLAVLYVCTTFVVNKRIHYKTDIRFVVAKGRCYRNQLILEHFGRRQNRPPSLVALAF